MKTLSYSLCAVLAAGFAFTGDAHAVNISKETVFMATSRDVRHAPEFKKSALRKELE